MATVKPVDSATAAVLKATRSLLWVRTDGDARRISENLVRALGATLVPVGNDRVNTIPAAVSFGDSGPMLPSAPAGSAAHDDLDRYLVPFLLDVRRAVELATRTTRLAESAATDVLTGLPNRRMLERALGRLVAADVVIMLDLDHFKKVNDELGHRAGDDTLRAFGAMLHTTVRARDVVGRYGGEEFVVILGSTRDAEPFLNRLRTEWTAQRPYPITFSAGIAASVGDADATMNLVDEALYRAKDAGRDQWIWADAHPAVQTPPTRESLGPYLVDAVDGNRPPAIRRALSLLDNRISQEQIIGGLLATAQREVGERWYRNELTAADEHLATGVTAAALDALADETSGAEVRGLTVVSCAEGDWHSLAAQMFGESLRTHGFGVRILGASTPIDVVTEFLERSGSDSLAISCSMPSFFPGVLRLIEGSHRKGVPVIVGGRAFGHDSRYALRLGADAWAASAAEAAPILARWRAAPPVLAGDPPSRGAAALYLFDRADALGSAANAGLPHIANVDEDQLARRRERLVLAVEFLAAAILADDEAIFTTFLTWLHDLLDQRQVPANRLLIELDALQPLIAGIDAASVRLLETGRARLSGGGHPPSATG